MVCTTCEKKLQAVACPEKWKEGSNSRKVRMHLRLLLLF